MRRRCWRPSVCDEDVIAGDFSPERLRGTVCLRRGICPGRISGSLVDGGRLPYTGWAFFFVHRVAIHAPQLL